MRRYDEIRERHRHEQSDRIEEISRVIPEIKQLNDEAADASLAAARARITNKSANLDQYHAEMSRITGTGCQCSALVAACIGASPAKPLEAAAVAVMAMGLAGEIGWSKMQEGEGNSTYRNRIIDAIYNMDGETLDKGAKYEIR